jgi:hypothetical protein
MRLIFALFALAVGHGAPVNAATLSFNGSVYTSGAPPSDYFLLNPTKVGQTNSVRFYDDGCPRVAADVASGGETLISCYLLSWGIGSAGVNGPGFYSLTYDGAAGATPQTENFFFTLSFSPTRYIDIYDPNIPEEDYYLLGATLAITNSWRSTFSVNNEEIFVDYEAAIAPVPVPAMLPASGAGILLWGLLSARRRSKKRA